MLPDELFYRAARVCAVVVVYVKGGYLRECRVGDTQYCVATAGGRGGSGGC